jgi:hypothetical protein
MSLLEPLEMWKYSHSSNLTPSDIYRIQWLYQERLSLGSPRLSRAVSPTPRSTYLCAKEPLHALLCRISENTKDDGIRNAISAFHQDQGTAQLSSERPRASLHADAHHHDGNNERRRMSRVRRREKARKVLMIEAKIAKSDSRRVRACKIRSL